MVNVELPPIAHVGVPSKRATAVDLGMVALAVMIVSTCVKLVWPMFTFWGDNAESFFPLWHHLGQQLQEGRWIALDGQANAWSNVVAESAYGIYNPVTLANMLLVSLFDDLARASFVVITEFLVILGTGVYLTARSYGASRAAAVLVGVVLPFSGFTLFYEAGNWASGLMAVAWVSHFWWATRKYAQGTSGPLAMFITGALAISVGNPYSLLAVVILLFAFAVEISLVRRWRRLIGLVVVGLMVGVIVMLTYAPLMTTVSDTLRVSGAPVINSGYLVPALSDFFSAGSPSRLPQFAAWRATNDAVPSLYLSFAVVLLLPWLQWSRPRSVAARASLLTATVVFLLFAIGPEQVWLFRWPIRFVEYFYLGAAIAFAVVLSRGVSTANLRVRLAVTAGLILYGFGSAWAVTPDQVWFHLGATVIVAALAVLGWVVARRHGVWGLTAVAVFGTMVVAMVQVTAYRWDGQAIVYEVDIGAAHDLTLVRAAAQTYEGTVLQVAALKWVKDPETVRSGQLAFGNTLVAADVQSVNRYTGLRFGAFSRQMCVDYRGEICTEDAVPRLFRAVPGYARPLIDLMGIDTLVLDNHFLDAGTYPGEGWTATNTSADEPRGVFVRVEKQTTMTEATGSRGVDVVEVVDHRGHTTIQFNGGRTGGTVLLGRLAWTGYDVTVDGEPTTYATGPYGLMEIDVPPGVGELAVTFEVPGQKVGFAATLLAFIGVAVHQMLWVRGRSRARGAPLNSDWTVQRGGAGASVSSADDATLVGV